MLFQASLLKKLYLENVIQQLQQVAYRAVYLLWQIAQSMLHTNTPYSLLGHWIDSGSNSWQTISYVKAFKDNTIFFC